MLQVTHTNTHSLGYRAEISVIWVEWLHNLANSEWFFTQTPLSSLKVLFWFCAAGWRQTLVPHNEINVSLKTALSVCWVERLLTYFLVSLFISRSSSSLSFSTKLSKTGISNFMYWATWGEKKIQTYQHERDTHVPDRMITTFTHTVDTQASK